MDGACVNSKLSPRAKSLSGMVDGWGLCEFKVESKSQGLQQHVHARSEGLRVHVINWYKEKGL